MERIRASNWRTFKKITMNIFTSYKKHNNRAKFVCSAFQLSAAGCGDNYVTNPEDADVLFLYGMSPQNVLYRQRFLGKKHIFIGDLGYWDRYGWENEKTKYRISYRDHHPNYAMDTWRFPETRSVPNFSPISNPQSGYILLAGMGQKSMHLFGMKQDEWDIEIIKEIKKHTDKEILYRPKPSYSNAVPLNGTKFESPNSRPIQEAVGGAYAIVTHHSNVMLDAALMGIKGYCVGGIGTKFSMSSLEDIHKPNVNLLKREEIIKQASWYNWSLEEIKNHSFWKHWRKVITDEHIYRV